MFRRSFLLVLVCGLVAVGCESQYQVRGIVFGGEVEESLVKVVREPERAPAGRVPLENATVGLQVYQITGELSQDYPPYEYYTSKEGEFRFELPETLLDLPGRLLIGAKTKYRIRCERVGYEVFSADVLLPLERRDRLLVILRKLPQAGQASTP
jgi:hypothetical protein